MKKLLIVLAILLVAGVGAFADATVGGEFGAGFIASGNPLSSAGVMGHGELNVNGAVDDNTSVAIELDWEYGAIPNVAVDDFRLNSSVLAALGIDAPVSVDLTVGYFDTYFTNWNYVNSSITVAWDDFVGPLGVYNLAMQPTANLAGALKIGFGDFALHYWNSFNFGNMAVAFSGAVSVLNFLVGFAADYAAIGSGTIYAELGANVDLGGITLFIPAAFALTIGTPADWSWQSGVKVGIMDYATVAIGAQGEDGQVFRKLTPEVHMVALAGLDLYAKVWVDLLANSAFKSVDVGLKYNIGAMDINPGVVIAPSALDSTSLGSQGDEYGVTGTGFYLIFHTAF
jgi:hypothetical protein